MSQTEKEPKINVTVKKSKKELKNEKNKRCESLYPVFKLKILSKERAICKYIGNGDASKKLLDEPLEIIKDQHTIELGTYGRYTILLKGCNCNITGSYLLKNKKLPLFYVTMLYCSQLVAGYLYTIFVYFTMNEQTSQELKVPRDYVNKYMSGTYTMELLSDEGFLSYIIEKKRSDVENLVMEKYFDEFNEASDNKKMELMNNINLEVEKELDVYRNMFEPVVINEIPKKSALIEKIKSIYSSEKFTDLIKIGLLHREEERQEKYGKKEEDFKIPEKSLKLTDFRNNLGKIDEYIDNLQSDSDCTDSSND